MASVFTRIEKGELPGRVVWRDEKCFALLTIRPIKPGHLLVVPREEVEHWIDLSAETNQHLFEASRQLGRALQQAFSPVKVGVALAGLEVPHVHVHLIPIEEISDMSFEKQRDASPGELDAAAEKIRAALRDLGYPQVSS
jgi:histidine triad (HIT) family protein